MSVREDLIRQIPNLRAFAVSLSGNAERADDLVQEALMKAWASIDMFEPGTNMRAWLFTILRNVYYSEFRKKRREVEDADGKMAANLATHPEQLGHLDMVDFKDALDKLAPDQREALVLVGASGFSYDEAAVICGCAVGTVKSRVNRARSKLGELLAIRSGGEYGPDHFSRAVVDARKV
ncbi:MAG: sigma-70 family RNA polymerase sigma factor [Pseudomonadota bacterium]